MLVVRADCSAVFIETRLHICKCVLDGAAECGKGTLLTGRTADTDQSDEAGDGTANGGVSTGSDKEASRCKENAGWMLKTVGDEESAREMCKDIEDKSSSGIMEETLNIVEKGNQKGKEEGKHTRLDGYQTSWEGAVLHSTRSRGYP